MEQKMTYEESVACVRAFLQAWKGKPLRPHMIVAEICKKDSTIDLRGARVLRDAVDTLQLRGELCHAKDYSGVFLFTKKDNE